MQISRTDWSNYIKKLSAVNKKAADVMQQWMDENPTSSAEDIVAVAHAVAEHYGEAAGSLACTMYDAIAEAQGVSVPPALPAQTATYGETAKAVYGTMKNQDNTVAATVGRLVKMVGADTMLQNARRDGAQFAWIPMGDTCAFCLTLASRGWQYQSKKARAGDHAEHIHANCDCEYAIRFDGKSTVEGYDPDALQEKYYSFEGKPQEKINAWRRERYAADPERYRTQKRILYDRNRRLHYGAQNSFLTDRGVVEARRVDKYGYNNIFVDNKVSLSERQLRNIDRQISEAKTVLGLENGFDAKVVVTEMGEVLASYNPHTNVLLMSTTMTSEEAVIAAQQGFACPEDVRSTAVHELIHWMDADEYRRTVGPIEDASSRSEYSVFQRERCYDLLKSRDIDADDIESIRSISLYAYQSALDNDWEEVYTEFRTKEVLA